MLRWFLFLFVFINAALFGSFVEESLHQVPESEREKMECFFDYAIKIGNSGHVLYFDSKPMCFMGIWLMAESNRKFREGWYAFKKYENLFPHNKFIFNEQIKDLGKQKVIQIFLINKKVFVDCVDKHADIIESILRKKLDGNNMLIKMEQGEKLLDLIEDNELILGVLLGYGEESSKSYYFRSIEGNEDNSQSKNYKIISPEKDESNEIYPVSFMGDPSSNESQIIFTRFKKEWVDLWEIYLKRNKDSTTFFLEGLCR